MSRICLFLGLVWLALTLTGCATRVWNQPIGLADDVYRYDYDFRTRLPRNADDLFIVLAFSGGGTRSAAFTYGVL